MEKIYSMEHTCICDEGKAHNLNKKDESELENLVNGLKGCRWQMKETK